ncbi:MAG: hypothetical protein Q8P91_00705 [bacterium]|nr:hypothetical protein [bacterium]
MSNIKLNSLNRTTQSWLINQLKSWKVVTELVELTTGEREFLISMDLISSLQKEDIEALREGIGLELDQLLLDRALRSNSEARGPL